MLATHRECIQVSFVDDDRPRAPTSGPPITIPSPEFLGRAAYYAWYDAHRYDPVVGWRELSEAERDMWQRIATKVAERIRIATERSHALGNYPEAIVQASPSSALSSRDSGQAPMSVAPITVWVSSLPGLCTLRKETPAS